MALFAIVPWILFGIMVLFGLIFAIVAWRATRRAGDMEEGAERAQHALSQMEARQRAQQADSALQHRRDEAQEKQRKSQARARSLLSWARQQWEARREPDRQKAQGQQGSFQAQLDAFLDYRRKPVTFRVEGEIDRMAAPLLGGYAQDETVEVDGDLVRVTYPVDPALGFRA